MDRYEFDYLHVAVDRITSRGLDKQGYTLIRYADVKVMLDKAYEHFNKKLDVSEEV